MRIGAPLSGGGAFQVRLGCPVTDLLFLSLLALSLGSLLCLPFISVREIGRGFFTLWICIVGLLSVIALGLHLAGLVDLGGGAHEGGWRIRPLLVLVLVLLAVFWAALRWERPRAATLLLLLSALCGALVLRELAMAPTRQRISGPASGETSEAAHPDQALPVPVQRQQASLADAALRVTSLLASAMAVGAVSVAMVLGHWYLVQLKLAIAPLRRLCDIFVWILIVRLCVSGWGIASSLHAGHRLLGEPGPIPWEALILSQRLLFGFGGSLVLAIMIKRTVALRATMSATGLLYIAILFVWVGEFLSIYLFQLTAGGLVV